MNTAGKYSLVTLILFILQLTALSAGEADILNSHVFDHSSYKKQFSNKKITADISSKGEKAGFAAQLFMQGVWVYKDIISPQDMDVCTFYPSCSEYAFISLRSKSFPEAILDTGDRILRCYGGNHAFYKQDFKRKKSIDFPRK